MDEGNNIKYLKEAYVVRCSIQNSKGIGCHDARYHAFILDIGRYLQKMRNMIAKQFFHAYKVLIDKMSKLKKSIHMNLNCIPRFEHSSL